MLVDKQYFLETIIGKIYFADKITKTILFSILVSNLFSMALCLKVARSLFVAKPFFF